VALCGATIAVTAPMIFAAASFAYFSRAPFTTPLETAVIYVALVVVLDFAVVATSSSGVTRCSRTSSAPGFRSP